VLSYFNLFKSYLSKTNFEEKNQLKLVLWGTSIGFLFGMIFDLVLPFMGDYKHIFVGPVFSLFMVASIAYAITKYKMFNMKVVVTQMLMIILWIFILARTLLADTLQEQLIDVVLLLATVIIGIFLIKSVLREVSQREKIEKLAGDLEIANERLKELDQLKSEFLSLATHQIRAPLTAIKGYASLIMEGDYGEVSEPVRGAVKTIFSSCENLVVIVSDFLNISRIEQGKMKYDMIDFDVVKVVKEIINELRPNIEAAKLSIDFKSDVPEIMTHADLGKVKQIIGNLIDNSIKYTKAGGISLHVKMAEKRPTK
jgi:signal transduction histidine kinase